MPLKRRTDKRRPTVTPEAWEFPFKSGHDYFNKLDALEPTEPHLLPPNSDTRADAQAEWDDAIRAAWAEHGPSFMPKWRPKPGQPLPWAAVRFGLPGAC